MQVLGGVLLRGGDGSLELAATDMELSLRLAVEAQRSSPPGGFWSTSHRRKAEADPAKKLTQRQLFWMCLFALAALTGCVGSIPESPLLSISWFSLKIGGAAVIVLAVIMPKAAEVVGIAPE